ncbi:MAG: IS1595 family transposase [Nitrospira sp.]|nr:IS1595 family transposase [Nitrospira sp.]
MIYRRRSRLNGKQQGRLIDLFVAGATARAAAELVGVNRNTARVFYHRLRQLIGSKRPSYDLSGEVEADESYFGGVRKGNRGRGAAGKVPVFGLLKRGGKVIAAIIPNAQSRTLLPIIREQVPPDSIVYVDSFTAYDVLDVSEFHPRRVNHSKVFVTKRGHHINGIEKFWNQAKRHLRRFNGITPDNCYWFLKECEWRFNNGNHQQLLKQLKSWYKSTKH